MRSQIVRRLSRSCVTMKTVRPSVCCSVRISEVEVAGGDRIEAGGRLVEEDDLRIERQRAGERHALGHAAGKLGGKLVGVARREADHLELGDGDLVHQPLGDVEMLAHRELHVLAHGQRGEQRALLEEHAPAALDRAPLASLGRVQVDAEHLDRARCFGMRPMMVRSSTDLPLPEPPTRPRISPRRTSSDRWSSTMWSPKPTTRSRTRITMVVVRRHHGHIPIEAKKMAKNAVEHDHQEDRLHHRGRGLAARATRRCP